MLDFPKSARLIAVQALNQFQMPKAFGIGPIGPIGPILEPLLDQTNQRQRATDLVRGTVRNLTALDKIITKCSGRPIKRIATPLLAIIRVGAYELVYSPATPPYSIVDEAVKTARRFGGKKQTGFVNAVLRQVLRHIKERQAPLADSPPRRTLIQTTETGCQVDIDILPDPDSEPASYLSDCFSLPQWLVEEWIAEFGFDRAREICMGSNRRPSVYIRINPLKTTPEDLLKRFEAAGVDAELCRMGFSPCGSDQHGLKPILQTKPSNAPTSEMIRTVGPQSVAKLPGFDEGLFAVQDLSASEAVRMLDPQPGWKILDLCAAPGTKAMQLAEATGDAAEIFATDIDAKRLEKVHENVARLGFKSVKVFQGPKALGIGPIGPIGPMLNTGGVQEFDAVLVDVPCSNTGVLAKRIEVRFRISPEKVKELAETQRRLLKTASELVKPGGKICYSTCSIQRAENEDVVRAFIAANKSFELVKESLITPSAKPPDRDGAYIAILKKI